MKSSAEARDTGWLSGKFAAGMFFVQFSCGCEISLREGISVKQANESEKRLALTRCKHVLKQFLTARCQRAFTYTALFNTHATM